MAEIPTKSKNWLLVKFRQYHTWLGVGLSAFIIVICLTGIYLNHKPFFNQLVGQAVKEHDEQNEENAQDKKKKEQRGKQSKTSPRLTSDPAAAEMLLNSSAPMMAVALVTTPSGREFEPRRSPLLELTTATSLQEYPIGFEQALRQARDYWQDRQIALEKIELRSEEGEMVYKIKDLDEREVIINAATGKLSEKIPHQDWGKTLKDLHTGKIGGTGGKLFVDFVSVVMLFLTASGIYLWVAPIFRKRNKSEKPQASAETKPIAISSKSNELLEKLRAKKAASAPPVKA